MGADIARLQRQVMLNAGNHGPSSEVASEKASARIRAAEQQRDEAFNARDAAYAERGSVEIQRDALKAAVARLEHERCVWAGVVLILC